LLTFDFPVFSMMIVWPLQIDPTCSPGWGYFRATFSFCLSLLMP
jgi:hypothetical protein